MYTVRSFLRIYLIPLSCVVLERAAERNHSTLVQLNQSEDPFLRRSLGIWSSYRSVNERAARKSPMPNTDASTRRRRHEWCTTKKERQWPVTLTATKKRASRPDLALEHRPFAVRAIETGKSSSDLLQKVFLFWFPNRRDPVHAEIALQTRQIEDLQWTKYSKPMHPIDCRAFVSMWTTKMSDQNAHRFSGNKEHASSERRRLYKSLKQLMRFMETPPSDVS